MSIFRGDPMMVPVIGPCKCCGAQYREGRGCFGGSGYMCGCELLAPCTTCGRCTNADELRAYKQPDDPKLWFGHCRCRQQARERDEALRQQQVRDGW